MIEDDDNKNIDLTSSGEDFGLSKIEAPAVEEVKVDEGAIVRGTRLWIEKYIHNSPLSRHTESYNYLMEQLPTLYTMIDEEVNK